MNFKHYFLICVGAALLAMPLSCNKDDDSSSTSDYLSGSLYFSFPSYVLCDESFTVIPSGITNPTGDVGYYWKCSWEDANDTTKTETGSGDGRYTFVTPLEIGKYSVSCVAFATGYYTSSAIDTIYVVNPEPNTTITDAGLTTHTARFSDSRDGNTYYTTTFGGKTWTKNNIGYAKTGASYLSCSAMDMLFGKYYNWREAQTACPDGWHLPSMAEFTDLANSLAPQGTIFKEKETYTGIAGDLMVNAKFLDEIMWEFWPSVKITDKSGFAAIPVGYGVDQINKCNFSGLNSYAAFWTADSDDRNEDNGCYRYIYVDKPDVLANVGNKDSFRASVRCVKND